MDNRYATLPLWGGATGSEWRPNAELQAGSSTTDAGNLEISGPMLSIGGEWCLSKRWCIDVSAFYDTLALRAGRDLQTLFVPETLPLRTGCRHF